MHVLMVGITDPFDHRHYIVTCAVGCAVHDVDGRRESRLTLAQQLRVTDTPTHGRTWICI